MKNIAYSDGDQFVLNIEAIILAAFGVAANESLKLLWSGRVHIAVAMALLDILVIQKIGGITAQLRTFFDTYICVSIPDSLEALAAFKLRHWKSARNA
jgi:hypothetical protein